MSEKIAGLTSKFKLSPIVRGTIILTIAGMAAKILGFVHRIVLSRYISSVELGLYQVVQPLNGIIFSLCCVGFQSAVSRYTAKDKENGQLWLWSALLPSLLLSCAATVITSLNADFIATRILLFTDSADCVRMISLSFPFIALHNCFAGYYYGHRLTKVPAISQMVEQVSRIAVLFICYYCITSAGVAFKPHHAILGNVAGEIASCIYFIIANKINFKMNFPKIGNLVGAMKKTAAFSFPISVGSLLIHLFQSAEAVLIPAQLVIGGYTSEESLTLYGILSGMVLPLVMLPSVLTGSLAVLLMPSVAEDKNTADRTIAKTMEMCIILGIYSIFAYTIFIGDIGTEMFGNELVRDFTRLLAWLCPFMYLSQSMSSILNGAGKTTSTCIQNTLGILIRLVFLIALVPDYGITAYLIGLLVSKLVVCVIQYIQINRLFRISLNTGGLIINSILCSAVSFATALAIRLFCGNLALAVNLTLPALIVDVTALLISAATFLALNMVTLKRAASQS
jgi:stage V sporulation protein B